LVIGIQSFTNPFLEDSCDLFNPATKVVMPEEVKRDLCQKSTIGKELFGNFVKERIQSSIYSIWSSMKKHELLTGRTL